jgi:hypothetical protein
VLARVERAGLAGGTHRVRIVKRGGGVAVTWDDRPLTPAPVALPERWRGKVGLVAYRAGGAAALTVEDLALSSYPYVVRAVSASPSAEEVADLAREASAIAALSPAWVTIEGSAVREAPFDEDLFRILARRYAWDILPTVSAGGSAPPGWAAAERLAGLAARAGHDGYAGIRLDLTRAPRGAAAGWEAAARDLDAALRRVGKRLVVVR